jgi:CRP/FNR family cyclic AMP-dependent transcriptional regulator
MAGPTTQTERPDPAASPLAGAFRDGRRQRLRVGATLFTEGDSSSRVVLLLAGRVKVSSFSDEGQETVLAFRGAGDVLGEVAAIDGADHMATVTVVEEGEALIVPATAFLATLEAEPGIAVALLRSVIGRLRNADRLRAEFVALDVTGRVAQRLVELAASYGIPVEGGIKIGLPLSQRELAGWVGASREAVNKALAQLEGRDLVRRDHGSLIVRDVEGLRRRAS